MPTKKRTSWGKNKIIRAILLWVGLIVLSYLNATNFDKTELKFLGEAGAMWTILQKTLPD